MSAAKGAGGGPTPGPFLREGSSVYALHEHHLPSGKVVQVNRIYANVTAGAGVPSEEAEAAAALFAAAPDQHETLLGVEEWIVNHVPDCEGREWHLRAVRAALAKAGGES